MEKIPERRWAGALQSKQLIRRIIIGLGMFYLVFLLGVIAATSFKFREYYIPPALDLDAGETEVLRVWNTNYEVRYQEYRQFVGSVCAGLAIYLTLWAAALGVWKNSIFKGLIALVVGGFVTVLTLSLLPWVYFPFDKYPVSALWVIGASPWIALSWVLLTLLGRILRQRLYQHSTSD